MSLCTHHHLLDGIVIFLADGALGFLLCLAHRLRQLMSQVTFPRISTLAALISLFGFQLWIGSHHVDDFFLTLFAKNSLSFFIVASCAYQDGGVFFLQDSLSTLAAIQDQTFL